MACETTPSRVSVMKMEHTRASNNTVYSHLQITPKFIQIHSVVTVVCDSLDIYLVELYTYPRSNTFKWRGPFVCFPFTKSVIGFIAFVVVIMFWGSSTILHHCRKITCYTKQSVYFMYAAYFSLFQLFWHILKLSEEFSTGSGWNFVV